MPVQHSKTDSPKRAGVNHRDALELLITNSYDVHRSGGSGRIPATQVASALSLLSQFKMYLRSTNRRSRTSTAAVQDEFVQRLLEGFVYFLACEGFVKIGYSDTPFDRLSKIQTGNPFAVEYLGAIRGTLETEQEIHRQWAHLRHRGEWFKATPELSEALHALLAKNPEPNPEPAPIEMKNPKPLNDLQ